MATIKFLVQSKSDTAGIYVRLKEGRLIDIKAKTRFIIDVKNWSQTKGQPKVLKDESCKTLNSELSTFRNNLLKHYNSSVNKLNIDSQWLKDFINPPPDVKEISNNLLAYFDYYLLHTSSGVGFRTKQKLNTLKSLLIKFQQETKSEYSIKDVDLNFKLRFEEFCAKKNYAPNTTSQAIKTIKTICYHAQSNSIEVSGHLNNISVKWHKVEKIFLDPTDIALIEKAKFDLEHLTDTRDWLLISCETGQRVSDFLRFTKEMIRYEEGKPLIEFTQVKTNKIMTVPLSKKVMGILKRRKGDFPRKLSDQRYNEYIKVVCEQAGLTYKVKGSIVNPATLRKESGIYPKWQLVTSHIGRRSFATNNYGRIPTSLLIGATGHSTEKMFLEYIGKTDTQKAMQLAEYF